MTAVGETLLLWGFLETGLRKYLATQTSPPVTPRLNAISWWREYPIDKLVDEMEEVASLRNLLAHGLTSASADPWGKETPRVKCRAKDGVVHEITLDGLEDLKRRIHALTIAVRDHSTTFRRRTT